MINVIKSNAHVLFLRPSPSWGLGCKRPQGFGGLHSVLGLLDWSARGGSVSPSPPLAVYAPDDRCGFQLPLHGFGGLAGLLTEVVRKVRVSQAPSTDEVRERTVSVYEQDRFSSFVPVALART